MKFFGKPRPKVDVTKWHEIYCWRPRLFREDGPWGYGGWVFAWFTPLDRRWHAYEFDSVRVRSNLPLGNWQYRQVPLFGEG